MGIRSISAAGSSATSGAAPRPCRVCDDALALLRAVTLALRGRRRDEHLIRLRVMLRLAQACGHLQHAQMLHALERADAIGRQLGGWMKAREAG